MKALSEKSMKILTLALNEGAIEGEWQAAAVRFISNLRNDRVQPEVFAPLYRPSLEPKGSESVFTMPFGKYKGQPISEVDDGYLIWLSEKADLREPMKSQVNNELEKRGL